MSKLEDKVWSTLLEVNLVEGEAPTSVDLESPWYVKTLLAFCGWFASLFILGFIGTALSFVIDSAGACFLVGGFLIGGAFFVLRLPKNEFFVHMALAFSLAGQALIVFAFFRLTRHDHSSTWTLIALLQTVLAIVMPNFVHRVFSSFFAAFSFSAALSSAGILYLSDAVIMLLVALLWLNEFHFPRHIKKIRGIGYGLVLALIQIKSTTILGMRDWNRLFFGHRQNELVSQPWVGELLASVTILFVVWQLLKRNGHSIFDPTSIAAIVGTTALCAASFEAQGISIGVTIILLAFAGSNRVLLALGTASLLGYVSYYYYQLDITLLAKSQTLFLTGAILLCSRFLLGYLIPRLEEEHA